jgi:hypothetical protein
MGWTAGVRFPAGARDFSLLSVQTHSRVHPASYPVGNRGSFPGGKVAGHEADHSPPSSAKVKNGGAIPPLPHTSSWRGAQLIKHMENISKYSLQTKVTIPWNL